jgi:electron transfer flavoprotein beta subunit
LHIVVVTKNTPDTAAAVTLDSGGNLNWGDKMVINPWDEYAITEAVLLKDAHQANITITTLGSEEHAESLKHGIAVGCDQAIRIWDAALKGHDSLVFARAVAAAIHKLGDADLVIFGKEFSDEGADAHIFQTARKLGWNMLSFVSKIDAIDPAAKTIRVQRLADQGTETVSSQLPAVISVMKDINEPKYPTFIGIRKAGKVQIPVWGLGDLGLDADAARAKTQREKYRELPQREGAVEIIAGASVQEQAATLVDKLIGEKIV